MVVWCAATTMQGGWGLQCWQMPCRRTLPFWSYTSKAMIWAMKASRPSVVPLLKGRPPSGSWMLATTGKPLSPVARTYLVCKGCVVLPASIADLCSSNQPMKCRTDRQKCDLADWWTGKAQHSTSTAQHCTAKHSTAQHCHYFVTLTLMAQTVTN